MTTLEKLQARKLVLSQLPTGQWVYNDHPRGFRLQIHWNGVYYYSWTVASDLKDAWEDRVRFTLRGAIADCLAGYNNHGLMIDSDCSYYLPAGN